MNKLKYILIIVFMIAVFSFVIFMNYDRINDFINNKQWQVVNSIATIHPDKFLQVGSSGDKLVLIESDKISAFTNSNISEFSISSNIKEVVVDSCRDYCVIGENGGGKLILLNDKGKLWEFDTKGEILSVSVNKNGYVSCIYAKSGYKSLIKVINPNGEELFTNHLASTYAVDSEISNDNKFLAIAEVNTEGINMESSIKVVDMNNTTSKEIKNVSLDSNTLVLDIEYTDKNDLLILEDSRVEKLSTIYEKSIIKEFKHNEISNVTIENNNNAIIVEKSDTGIFSTEYILKIYDSAEEFKEYVLDTSSELVHAQGKTICISTGNQLMFLNTNGKLLKRCRVDGQVRDIKLYGNGTMAAVIFRDRIDIIKL